MADLTHLRWYINHQEVEYVTWDQDGPEEVLGGTGRCTLNVQDRTNTWEPVVHWDVKGVIRATDWVIFRGEIEVEPVELITGHPWRTWKLDCADYNIELGRRLVGALDGKTWMDPMGFGFYINIDPYASSLATDKLTVQQLFDHYIRVDGEAFDTATFVEEYLSDMASVTWDYKYLKNALDEMAAMVVQNLQYWADPDLKFHWVAIPAWQDLAQEMVEVAKDPTASTTGMMMPEAAPLVNGLGLAPADISDLEGHADDSIGFSKLTFELDGSDMPEQVYVRGGTGYVYNAPGLTGTEDKTVVKAPTPGTPGAYELTIDQTTKLWHTDSTGYVSTSYDSVGPGGPWPVKWVTIPWNAARNKGGNYWKILSGPYAGKLADDNTNSLSGYGHITVYKVTSGASEPLVGIGGTGWANEVTQDPNKRQAYLEAPVSTDKAKRDALGGQALYRGSFPTLRGSVVARGIDGWRAGQLVRITDERLPTYLNGEYFVIQRVKMRPLPETGILEYTLDWGDGPKSRYSNQPVGGDVNWPPPVIQIEVAPHDLSPGPSSTQIITGQLVDGSGKPWAIPGKTVDWSFECYNRLGTKQSGQGSITPTVSITDKHGRAYTKLTTGPGVNLVYFVFADVKVT